MERISTRRTVLRCIFNLNPLRIFVPCVYHTLNLLICDITNINIDELRDENRLIKIRKNEDNDKKTKSKTVIKVVKIKNYFY